MAAETVYNITIPSTSATLTYSPYVTDSANSGGWQSVCPTNVTFNGTSSWICDPDSAHTTSSYKASFELSFNGVGIYLIGNTTNNLGYDVSLDGFLFPGNFRSNAQLLYSSVDLQPGPHTIALTVRQPALADNPGSVTLKEVVVDAGTGRSRATVMKTVLNDDDPSITYYAPPDGNWTNVNAYPQATQPEGIKSSTFHDSYSTNATATIGFKGVGISVYGACYSHSRYAAYSASIDGTEEIQYDGTVNLYSIGGDVKQRAGNCLRYFKTGLDGDKDHQLVLKVKDMGRLAVDWVEVYTVEGGQQFSNGTGTQLGGNSSGMSDEQKRRIIAGVASVGTVLVLGILVLIIFLMCIRRKRSRPQDILTPAPNQNGIRTQEGTSFVSTPFAPNAQANLHGTSAMPTWPQPQIPAPSTPKRYMTGAPPILSYPSGSAPLASPGLSSMSSYTESSGSGPWPDSAGYQTTEFNYTAPLRPSISRPSYTDRVSSSGPEPGVAFAGGGGMVVSEVGAGMVSRPGYQVHAGGVASPVSSSTSPAPPAYEQIEVPDGLGGVSRVRRVQ